MNDSNDFFLLWEDICKNQEELPEIKNYFGVSK